MSDKELKAPAMIHPLRDYVLVIPQREEVSAGGIVLPDNARKTRKKARVVAVGPGAYADGEIRPVRVKAGQHVILAEYAGIEVKQNGVDCLLVQEPDVIAVIEE